MFIKNRMVINPFIFILPGGNAKSCRDDHPAYICWPWHTAGAFHRETTADTSAVLSGKHQRGYILWKHDMVFNSKVTHGWWSPLGDGLCRRFFNLLVPGRSELWNLGPGKAMEVSWYIAPPNHPRNRGIFHYKPSFWGYPYFRKSP